MGGTIFVRLSPDVYDLVLVGYGANDPPLKYLFNVIASDRRRFTDLKKIYAFDEANETQKDEKSANWRAKGVEALIYAPGENHCNLYETLAEWSQWVDNRQAWTSASFSGIGKRTYQESSENERSLMQLLLHTPTRCQDFRKAGGDFSWIRIIEAQRIDHSSALSTQDSQQQHQDYLTSLKVWLQDALNESDAIAWATERLVPKGPELRLSSDHSLGDNLAEAELYTFTRVRGFSSAELAVIERSMEAGAGNVAPQSRRYWHLLLETAAAETQSVYGYHLLEQLKAAEKPDPIWVQKLCKFLQPHLRIHRPWRPTQDDVSEAPFEPSTIVRFSLAWNGHPSWKEVTTALPTNGRWLGILIEHLNCELDRLYHLAERIGLLETVDALSRGIRRVGPPDTADDPDHNSSGYYALTRVMAAAWVQMAELDVNGARLLATRWLLREEEVFRRLFF